MKAALKAELRKLLTVRSTYGWTGFIVLFVTFIAFYVEGWRLNSASLHDPMQLANDVTGAMGVVVLGSIVAILLVTHEYRHNTIVYTLTGTNSRSKVLLAKFLVLSVYALLLSAVVAVLSPTMSYLGAHAAGHSLVPQTLHVGSLAWQVLFYGWGYIMSGLLLALLVRSQATAIVALFAVPGIINPLLALLLKKNAVYLPFTSLDQIINHGPAFGGGSLAPGKAALVSAIYLAVFGFLAWVLFLKRDAN